MYSSKNIVGLSSRDGVDIYLDLTEGDLKKQVNNRKISDAQIYLASIIALPIVQLAFFKAILADVNIRIFLFFLSLVISFLLSRVISKKIYQGLTLERVQFSCTEFEEFKKDMQRDNENTLILGIIFALLLIVFVCLYFLRPRIFFLLTVDCLTWALSFMHLNKIFSVRQHFERYLDFNKVYRNESL